MNDKETSVYLDVPVTESERTRARQQEQIRQRLELDNADASDRLLPEPRYIDDSSSSANNVPLRFPSIHTASEVRQQSPSIQPPRPIQPAPCPVHGHQRSSIPPIYEEDEPEATTLRDLPSRFSNDDEGLLLPAAGPVPPLWSPIWLRKWFLAIFSLVFTLFFIALILLWYYDRENDGFAVTEGTSHYAWAYAPTVIVVFVVAAWRMVDHHAKLAMPFDALQDGPVKASESLLVDYISSFQLVSLVQAARNAHLAVITSVTGFVLLKIITVFSTGLLVLLPTAMRLSDVTINTLPFDAASFDPAVDLDPATFSSFPVYAYYGTLVQGVPLDNGLTLDLAYSTVTLDTESPLPDGATIEAKVDAFVPTFECKELDLTVDSPRVVDDSNAAEALADSANISLTIKAGDACSGASSVQVPADDPYTEITPDRQVLGTLQEIYCGSPNASESDSAGPVGILFTATDITYQQSLFDNATDLAGGTFTIAGNVSRTLNTITNIFCTASYTITQVKITHDTRLADSSQAITIESVGDASNTTLPKLSDWNLTSIYTRSSVAAQALFGDTINQDTISDSSAMFQLMALAQGSDNIDVLLNPAQLMTAAEQTYKGIISQYAHQNLRATSTSPAEDDKVSVNTPRLRVNDVSVWTMGPLSAVLALLAITLIFIAPRHVVPRDPSSIASIATILSRSVELNRILRRRGPPNLKNQKLALSGYEFGSAIATSDSGRASYKIVTSEGVSDEPDSPSEPLKWWLPVSATIPFLVITLIIPVVLVIVLEVLQRSSNKNNGLFSVADDKWTEVYSHYIPSLVMLIMASLINMLDFNVALFAPWSNLARGNAISKRSVLNNLLGRSPPAAFLQAFKTRNFGAVMSILAATLASILAVIASGLYTVEHFTEDGPSLTLRVTDSFGLTWDDSFTTDKGAAAMVDMIMHKNMQYPHFTYEGLALPSLLLDNSEIGTNFQDVIGGSYSEKLEVLRGNLRCEILDEDSFDLSTEDAADSAYPTDMAFVTVNAPLPESCHLGGSSGDDSVVTYENNFALLADGQETFAGAQLDLLFGENATIYGNFGEDRGQYIGDNPPVGCPSLAFTFGKFELGSDDKSQVTTMICYQEIHKLEANVTMKWNSTMLDPEHPPVVDNGSVEVMENPANSSGVESFDFRIQNNLAEEMTLFSGGNGTPASNPSAVSTVDIYFQAIIDGPNGHDPASLVGKDNQQALEDAINEFYQMYMAQVISANMRVPETNQGRRLSRRQSSNTIDATSSVVHTRLVQHKLSKIVLQVLLCVMTGLAAASWLTTKFRRVLPCNPCSLAGTMSLLAGSDLCYAEDEGICECCGKTRRRSFGLEASSRPQSIHVRPDEDVLEEEQDERQQLIPAGAEWMRQDQFSVIFGGKRYSTGWWRERAGIGKRRRFGVDVGERADGADDQDWELGPRKPEGSGFEGFMMRGGDRQGRGEYQSLGAHGRRPSATSPDPGYMRDGNSGFETNRPPIGPGGGGPGPATLARRSTSIMGGEA
ncbi:hypothetical protein PV10_05167 [Exophiala mesophila]|uniref:Uncharacterized protein n=1 Tax=Exophiala mesophila TaxID=212818 RepID=A0A0D2A4W5_EXOME|nr:uncharacterized protein PV10_05167 [Exophiala mesophila]KIV94003.1 hypothetical protein PV10_05167 [Exophiala mesophila]